ncbi:GNAT family N-acetyltransferase [Xenorhabdus innexi]|uniref:N-acetyltransferase n=1 Tax=Xenorhabdus innexi TaxID=290109 RepID=A0A1N6MVN6_9GAMM|nr:GNAT family N-acetyltransferase [Xenorhabdus innexi]PHM38346.1 N-acetyltransferase [Xenorhabdus innexi]SIP72890.1 GCN5-related N-acetyltransferase [Xenorhabdus innexi]
MFTIRPAQVSDINQLAIIEHSAAQLFRLIPELFWIADGHVQTEKQHLAYIVQNNSWVALDNNGVPVGFILAKSLDGGLHIVELSVHGNWQRKGIGKALMETVIQVAENRRLKSVTLTTFRHVIWNAPFYQKLGFSILESQDMSEELQQILQDEIEYGFSAQQRCAMKRTIII